MVSRNPKISIITPVYNGASRLKKCAKALLSQPYAELEWILIDDGSKDDTLSVMHELGQNDNRIKVFSNVENRGPYHSRCLGIENASGEYIGFLDDDDQMAPNALSVYSRAINSCDSDLYLFSSKLVIHKWIKLKYYESNHCQLNNTDFSKQDFLLNIINGDDLTPNIWDKLYKTDILRKSILNKNIDLKVGEDLLINILYIPNIDHVSFIPEYVYMWKYSGMGYKYYIKNWDEYIRMIDLIEKCIINIDKKHNLPREALQEALTYRYLNAVRESVIQRKLYKQSAEDISLFIQHALDHRIIKYIQKYEGIEACNLSSEIILQLSLEHLHKHKKFYIFTHILNKIRN